MTTEQTTQNTVAISFGDKLEIPSLKGITMELDAGFSNSPFLVESNPLYQLRDDTVREIAAFLKFPFGDALYIAGPTGSGKTSVMVEVAARLGWPIQSVTAHGRMELTDLVGFTVPVVREGVASMEFQYGPLAKAMKEGHILLINELDLMDPAELAGLNDVLEGRPLVVAQNGGEVIKPHPLFRVCVTANSNGAGDDSGMYQGVMQQNMAAMDRYRMLMVDYADAEVEERILAVKAPNIQPLHKGMVEMAQLVRTAFTGDPAQPDAPTTSVTMSTRTLVRWANLTMLYGGAPNAMEKALDCALLNRGSHEDREVILRFAQDVFGDTWTGRNAA